MGCTPSIHVSHTGVVYCRDNEEANSPPGVLTTSGATATTTTTATTVHVSARGGPGRGSGRSQKEKHLAMVANTTTTTSSSHGSQGGSPSAALDVGGNRGDGGRLSVTLSEAETQTSRQSMKFYVPFRTISTLNQSGKSLIARQRYRNNRGLRPVLRVQLKPTGCNEYSTPCPYCSHWRLNDRNSQVHEIKLLPSINDSAMLSARSLSLTSRRVIRLGNIHT
ncbi:phosphodiesterase [Plakobranchus ocellatus]|uniref:Phosphodiesterase n=1 Tax=Plakobranchus ocellatus TaxID=259542 RepID=A0AAV4CHN4_9GAST|nr:phosphodiesterase [Plakobranchus ocellatus]